MKKTIIIAFSILLSTSLCYAQDEEMKNTRKGSFLIEVNTGFGEASEANTSMIFRKKSTSDQVEWAAGGEAGYFIIDDLALKLGLGYSDLGSDDNIAGEFHWKFGAKYYLIGKVPIQLDINGSRRTFGDDPIILDQYPIWVGIQVGYAFMVAENISIEPGLRFAQGVTVFANASGTIMSANLGFNIFFRN